MSSYFVSKYEPSLADLESNLKQASVFRFSFSELSATQQDIRAAKRLSWGKDLEIKFAFETTIKPNLCNNNLMDTKFLQHRSQTLPPRGILRQGSAESARPKSTPIRGNLERFSKSPDFPSPSSTRRASFPERQSSAAPQLAGALV